MSEQSSGAGSGPAGDPPPQVEHPGLADALAGISDLDARPLAEHPERLTRVHEVLRDVLHPEPDTR